MPPGTVLTLAGALMVAYSAAFSHHTLHRMYQIKEFLSGCFVPRKLVQIVLPVA
jgi:hypothetical protein